MATLIQIITGQNNLNYLTHKINPNISDQCRFCEEEEETFIHLLNECPVFHSHRLTLLKGSQVVSTSDWNPFIIIKFANIPEIKHALDAMTEE